jgi:flagellar protein FlgJ
LKEVAKQFEAIFLNNVLKGMREAKLADGITDNDQSKFYNDMYDQQLAVHLSGKPGVGLADLIVKQLSHDQPDNKKMGIEDYLNRSSGSKKTVPQSTRSDDKHVGYASRTTGQKVRDAYPTATAEIPLKDNHSLPIQSAEDFLQKLYPYAERAAQELGVEPKLLLAQAALETGWGRSLIKNSDGGSSFNLFNIKAGKSWQGKQAKMPTLEFEQGIAKKVNAGFRSYSSYQESFQDYVDFIKTNPRYGDALQQVGNGERYVRELQRAGYATDPSYANKVMGIYHGDMMAGFEPQTIVAIK